MRGTISVRTRVEELMTLMRGTISVRTRVEELMTL